MYKVKLPTISELQREMATCAYIGDFVGKSRQSVQAILSGEDNRKILIVGPCSIHDTLSAKEYALRLKELSEEIKDTFFLIMRTYFAKPRTTLGWKGILYDPHLNSSHDIEDGIRRTRQLLVDLAELGVPVATEILDPLTAHYFSDLITWGCIGARTAESQIHREVASGLQMPVAFKNNRDGNIQIAVEGAYTASIPHTYIGINNEGSISSIKTCGNKYSHIVLRGGVHSTNYDSQSIADAVGKMKKIGLSPKIIIDCSHDNSKNGEGGQIIAFESVIQQLIKDSHYITGMIIESNLQGGKQTLLSNQHLTSLEYGKSITDPCLDWEKTKELIRWGYNLIKQQRNNDENVLFSPSTCFSI